MSLFERIRNGGAATQKPESGERTILVPEDAGAAWTATVLAKYCDGSYRTKVRTRSYLKKEQVYRTRMRRYTSHDCVNKNGKPAKIEGRLVGVKLIQSEEDDEIYVPHVVLKEAEQEYSTHWVAERPEQKLIVPLTDNYEELILYPEI